MVCFREVSLRVSAILSLFVVVLSLAITSDVNSQGRAVASGDNPDKRGLVFRLSEGREEPKEQPQPQRVAPVAEQLDEEATQSILRRLPPIESGSDYEKDFVLPDRSVPPPLTGQTISESFPPAENAGLPEGSAPGPLEVLRFAPEGQVELASHLSITFSQPMVAVTSNTDLGPAEVPARLTPQPRGRWRWLGTKTLLFVPEGRFPMATSYTVEVPAGTRSLTGGSLAAARRWTFSTPPLRIKSKYPTGKPHSRDPLIFVEFNQRIDREQLLKRIRLRAAGRVWKLRLATAEEIAADNEVSGMIYAAPLVYKIEKDNWLAFRALPQSGLDQKKTLPPATTCTVTVEAGAPSAEGSRTTARPQSFTFSTYDPLAISSHSCGSEKVCRPGDALVLEFNNQLDRVAFDSKYIRVEPQLPGMRVDIYTSFNGRTIEINGQMRGNTIYSVTLDASIRDVYGQMLDRSRTVIFRVGSALADLETAADGFAVLDLFAGERFSVFSTNHRQLRVSLYAVGPEHWGKFIASMRGTKEREIHGKRDTRPMPPIGRLVSSKIIDVAGRPDDLPDDLPDGLVETSIDLKPALNDGFGQVILNVEAVQPPRSRWENRSARVWIQATNIGLDAFVDHASLFGWVTSLKDGKPLDDVEMKIIDEEAGAGTSVDSGVKTAKDGLARIPLPGGKGQKLLVARRGKDVALLPEAVEWWPEKSVWRKENLKDSLLWHVFDDRGVYRPGEEVHIKGWLRRLGAGPKGDVGLLGGAVSSVSYTLLHGATESAILKGSTRVNAYGGFDATFKLPETMNLGYTRISLKADRTGEIEDREFTHQFQVQEFRRPEYEVKATAGEGPHFVGDHANLTVAANYYAGGGLIDAGVQWVVAATSTDYSPPNRDDFNFGKWRPWWEFGYDPRHENRREFMARTDATGKHHLRIDFDSVSPLRPATVTARVNVQDVNRQSISESISLLVHPADLYVGIRTPRAFVQKGEPIIVESIVTDLDGRAVAGREIRMRAALLNWIHDEVEWREQKHGAQECLIKSGNDPAQCRFETKEGGRYRITAGITDDRGRRNESEMEMWVAGGQRPPKYDLEEEEVELVPDRKEYRSGDTAEILVQSTFYPAEGLMTLRRSGLLTSERFTMTSASHTLKIPISEELMPNVYVQVDIVGVSSRTDGQGRIDSKLPKRPAFASGGLNLSIPPAERELTVSARPHDEVTEPGAETFVDVQVHGAGGKPVRSGEVALVVVDEAALALTGYKLEDPVSTFYAERSDGVSAHHSREMIRLADPDELLRQMAMKGSMGLGGGEGLTSASNMSLAAYYSSPPKPVPTPVPGFSAKRKVFSRGGKAAQIPLRLNFNALAFFAPAVPIDAAEISLPVWTPGTAETFATYGEIDAAPVVQPIRPPSGAIERFGGLEVTTSSTQLQALTDAVLYLTSYPYECAEQISSRVLAIAALRDALSAFDAEGLPEPEAMVASIKSDMGKLAGMQNDDGGFSFWRRGDESWPYLGIHAAHAMQRAAEKGFDVPPEMFEKSKRYLKKIESHIPSNYGIDVRRTLIAYALYVRNRMGDRDTKRARALIAGAGGAEKLPLEAIGWILPVLSGATNSQTEAGAIRRHLDNRGEETAGAAHFTASYTGGAHLLLHSSRRADAVILEALIGDDPKNDLIPKVARGLLAHRGVYIAAPGRCLQLLLCYTCDNPRYLYRAAIEGRRDVPS